MERRWANAPSVSATNVQAVRAIEAQRAATFNFAGGQGNMAIGGVVAAGIMIGTRNVGLASAATDALAPLDNLLAPMGGRSAMPSASVRRTEPTTPGWNTFADNKVFTNRTTWTATRPTGTAQTYNVIQRNDIDWNAIRTNGPSDFFGRTNAEAAKRGYSPQLPDGNFATLHHIGQDARGPLAEANTSYHGVGKPGQDALHGLYGRNAPNLYYPINRDAFRIDSRDYWQWREQNR
jgi:hypothetical protein